MEDRGAVQLEAGVVGILVLLCVAHVRCNRGTSRVSEQVNEDAPPDGEERVRCQWVYGTFIAHVKEGQSE